jgi:hypothetical protein
MEGGFYYVDVEFDVLLVAEVLELLFSWFYGVDYIIKL